MSVILKSKNEKPFNADCSRCPRIKGHLKATQKSYPEYHCKPVPAFGDSNPELLIVGLAPGLHGANATGQPFTGDASGDLLFESLFEIGLCNKAQSRELDKKLKLNKCLITNAVKCYPPENKPTGKEVNTCSPYLNYDIQQLPEEGVILALGKIAHEAVLKALGLVIKHYAFAHNAVHHLEDSRGKAYHLVDSYHCSRYNLTTRRLTPAMFKKAIHSAKKLMP